MELTVRPKLVTFRAVRFYGDNPAPDSSQPWTLQTTQTVEVGLGMTAEPDQKLQAIVKIELDASATSEDGAGQPATFKGTYEGKYDYPPGTTLEQIAPLMAEEPYQYGLVSQAFPLAMTLFRRELQTLGFDARQLPLGI
jgi:hypothetical protein